MVLFKFFGSKLNKRILVLLSVFLIGGTLTGAGGKATAQPLLSGYFVKSSEYLLDEAPNAAAAYSLRKLNSNYTGSCIGLRRTSDGDSSTFSFTKDYVDTTQIKSFCAATDCYVQRWYDQGGNAKTAIQPDNSLQPQLISSGAFLRRNGKPALHLSANDHLQVKNSTAYLKGLHDGTKSSVHMVLSVGNAADINENFWLYGSSAGGTASIGVTSRYDDRAGQGKDDRVEQYAGNGTGTRSTTNQSADDAFLPNQQNILQHFYDADNATAADRGSQYVNDGAEIANNTETASPSSSDAGNDFLIGTVNAVANTVPATFQEVIIYLNDQEANRAAIRDNMNAFYSTY